MTTMFDLWLNRSARQPKRKYRPRCDAKTRAGGRCLVRVELLVDGTENRGWSNADCRSPASALASLSRTTPRKRRY
jgi:hypothetical protein